MAIRFNCANCGKVVKAPDNAAGKRATCPSCGIMIFIPRPKSESEEAFGVSAVDEKEEARMKKQLEDENREVDELLGRGTGLKDDDAGEKKPAKPAAMDEVAIEAAAVDWLLAEVEGRAEEAKKLAAKLKGHAAAVKMLLEALDPTMLENPALSDMPPPLLKKMREKLLAEIK
jgi:predicted  nucleic acid-binding Zn-ribbon protein